MITIAAFLVALQATGTKTVEEFQPGLVQKVQAECEAQVGNNRSAAFLECLETDRRLLAAEKACTKKHKNDEAAVVKCLGIINATSMPIEELRSGISSHHPADYYILAARLFQTDKKEDAVFWFYAGQLRWRMRLDCFGSEPGGESALFGAMNQQVGTLINEYAGGYPGKWVETIHRVVEWDTSEPSEFEDKQNCQSHIVKQRENFLEFAKSIHRDREKLARQRRENDLPNFEQ